VHPKFDTGAAENCTLATPVIEYKIFKICYAELPNILCFSRYLIIKIFKCLSGQQSQYLQYLQWWEVANGEEDSFFAIDPVLD